MIEAAEKVHEFVRIGEVVLKKGDSKPTVVGRLW